MRRIALLLFLLGVPAAINAETFTAQVIAVLDGDMVIVQQAGKKTTIRLVGIDAPEKLQEFGIASRDALAALVSRPSALACGPTHNVGSTRCVCTSTTRLVRSMTSTSARPAG